MSEFVMVKRELLEDLLGSAQAEAAERRVALGDFRPQVQEELDRVVAETRAVLAQEAGPVVERQEPVLDLESAAKVLANCMDYPWEHMPENGRALMRKHAKCIVDAALAQPNESGASE